MNATYARTNDTMSNILLENDDQGSWLTGGESDSGVIPFADEEPAIEPANKQGIKPLQSDESAELDPCDMGDSALEEFGLPADRMSVVDRDLGLDGHPEQRSSRGRYACPCCRQGTTRVMRVRVSMVPTHPPRWVGVCAVCAASMLAQIPGTIVGGMVRPTRRKNPRRVPAASAFGHDAQRRFREIGDTRYRRAG